ncbi:MAG: polysulfide reductase NrfD [Deltaproteobacteria bacterium]|nr:polysulfide reductase NrfD [Deltaproteobacteria bacterium]
MQSTTEAVHVEVSTQAAHFPRPRIAWFLFTALAVLALAAGIACYLHEHHHGAIVTGMRTPGYGGASWGLYIVFVVFFIGVSFAGITVAAMARLFSIEVLAPVTRIAELMTLVALLAGAACVVADLGRPLDGLLKLPRYANPSSPFFGTFTLVMAGYLFSSLVYFFLAGRNDAARLAEPARGPLRLFYKGWASGYRDLPVQRERHHRVSFWLALGILPLLITAHSTLGFVFGIQSGRPGWFSALQAPAFVVLAGVSGIGMLILVTLGFRWLFRLQVPDATVRWLGNFMWILAFVYLYFMIVEELTATYAAPAAERRIAHEIVGGTFAPLFWTTAGGLFLAFFIPFVLFVTKRTSMGWVALAGLLANVGAVGKRLLIVVPSQTHGALMPIETGTYTPTWVEIGVVLGLFGFIFLAMLVFGRVFPLVPSGHGHGHGTPLPDEFWRRALTALVVLAALGLVVIGLSDAFRVFSHGEYDPRIPFAPVIFASGVMLLVSSAAVYELLPDKHRIDPNQPH